MADETKPVAAAEVGKDAPVETPKETTEAPAAETTAPADEAPTTEEAKPADAAAEEAKPEESSEAKPDEEKKEEPPKPIEAGSLEHKGPFPKSLFQSKHSTFWLSPSAVTKEDLSAYLSKGKEDAHHLASWASETGKGLFFYGEEKDKVRGVYNLADASDPVKEGTNKFVLAAKGVKHTFKAPTTAERDSWVATLKEKIVEAKEVAKTVTETEAYKTTLESFKPAAPKKEEPKEEAAAGDDAKTEEAPVDEGKPEESKADEAKPEEPKDRRSASRKRTSMFGFLKKDKEEKKEEDETPAAEETKAEEPKAEEAKAEDTKAEEPKAEEAKADEAQADESKAEEPKAEEKKTEEAKPTEKIAEAVAKHTSVFSGFFKKKHHEADAKPEESSKDAEPVAENAPEIPPVETSRLSAEMAAPADAPAKDSTAGDASAEAAADANGETKKEMKSEKRKSSLPFAFGKKSEGAKSDDEGGAKAKSPLMSNFSKLRGTFKSKKNKPAEGEDAAKPEETKDDAKPEEAAKEEDKTEEPAAESKPGAPAPVAAAA